MPQRGIMVVNQYYSPDIASTGQFAAELCEALAARGWRVDVVAADPSYSKQSPSAPAREILNGVRVHRVHLGAAIGRESFATRLVGFGRFLAGARGLSRAVARASPPSVVLTFHNPPLVPWLGAALARRTGARFVYVPHDIHPDILRETGSYRLFAPFFGPWDWMHRRLMARADAVVVLGEGMRRTLVEDKGIPRERVQVIPVWGRPELQPVAQSASLRAALGVTRGELLVLYGGNMGVMQRLDVVLDAASMLMGHPVKFLLVGDGTQRRRVVQRVTEERLENVTVLPVQPPDKFGELVSAADVCLVTLRAGMERLSVPSRAYTFMSAGRALVAVMSTDAELVHQINEGGGGWHASDAGELAALLERCAKCPADVAQRGDLARRLYETRFSKDRVLSRFSELLEQTARSAPENMAC